MFDMASEVVVMSVVVVGSSTCNKKSMHDATPKPVSDGMLRQYTQLYNIHLRSVSWQLKIPHLKGINLLRLGRQKVNGVTFSINSVL